MGTVSAFPGKMVRPVPVARKPRGTHWRVVDLRGKHPRGHPRTIKKGRRGGVLLQVGQVWVELGSDRLWQIVDCSVVRRHSGTYPRRVTLIAYRAKYLREISEQTLRGCMEVWDVRKANRKAMMEKFFRSTDTDPQSPFQGKGGRVVALQFFGIDTEGNRID